ncbi:hypothetical protein C1H46_001369 [Malus baccata]|uniref:Uncharacterized protein n=1 Tax=Malus baccata TaxID=106549 RepID=A0A540NPM8_MALBA|nr:hypothetical protein C1H46_001369 [Malus baccata]
MQLPLLPRRRQIPVQDGDVDGPTGRGGSALPMVVCCTHMMSLTPPAPPSPTSLISLWLLW